MNLGERGTLNATDQNRFCLHDSNDDRWSMGLQFVDRNIRRDVSLVEERNDRISKRLKGKKKKRNWTKYWNDYDYDDCYVSFRFRTETEDPIVTLRYLEVRRFARCYKKKESVYLIFYFYRIWGNAGDGGRDFYAFESRVKFGLFSNQGKKNWFSRVCGRGRGGEFQIHCPHVFLEKRFLYSLLSNRAWIIRYVRSTRSFLSISWLCIDCGSVNRSS